jgi:hypothetical protein
LQKILEINKLYAGIEEKGETNLPNRCDTRCLRGGGSCPVSTGTKDKAVQNRYCFASVPSRQKKKTKILPLELLSMQQNLEQYWKAGSQ